MAYLDRAALEAVVPPTFVVQALDDNEDGVEDSGLWDRVVAGIDRQINSRLAPAYAVPLAAPYPDVVTEAAVVLGAEALYLRRGLAENPWTEQANAMRERLGALGRGEQGAMTQSAEADTPEPAVVSEPARLHDDSGRMLV